MHLAQEPVENKGLMRLRRRILRFALARLRAGRVMGLGRIRALEVAAHTTARQRGG